MGAPHLSPDGQRAVFPVGSTDLEAAEKWSDLWWIDLRTGRTHALTHLRQNDDAPLFSPDGRHILFESDREEGSQLFLMATAGGEARPLTAFPAGLSQPRWAGPDRIVAVSRVHPECGADPDCHERIAQAREDGPLKVHVAEDLLYRHWTTWRGDRYDHLMLVDAEEGTVLRDLTPGAFDSPTFSLGERGFDVSADGKWLCYVSNHDEEAAASTNADLWLLSLEDEGGPRNLTAANHGHDGSPLFSPDGGRIAYISQATPGYESDLSRLALVDLAGGEARYLTDRGKLDRPVTDMRFSPDGRRLYFLAEDEGRNALWRCDLDSGKLTKLHRGHWIESFEVTPDGKSLVFNERAMDRPLELYRISTSGKGLTRLTTLNQALEEEVDLRSPREIFVPVEDGRKVQCWIITPHGFDPDQRYPLIVNVHGGPQGAWSDNWRGDWQVYPGKGYIIAMPNPTGSTGFGQDLTDAIACDWGGRVYEDILAVTDSLARLPYVDPARMGLMGWSFGGYMVMWMEGHTDRFAAAASMMGLYDLRSFYSSTEELWFPEKDLCGVPWRSEHYERWSPSNHVEDFSTPCLVITGEKDFRVPYTQSLMCFNDLQKMGVESRLVVFPEAGHWPSWYEMAFYYNEHLAWFARHLGGGQAPYDPTDFSRNLLFDDKDPR